MIISIKWACDDD